MTFPSSRLSALAHRTPQKSSSCFDVHKQKRPLPSSSNGGSRCPRTNGIVRTTETSPEERRYRGMYISSARRLASSLNNIGAMNHKGGEATGALESYQQAVRVRMDSLRGTDNSTTNSTDGNNIDFGPAVVPPEVAEEMALKSHEAKRQEQALREAQLSDPNSLAHELSGLDLFDLTDGSASSNNGNTTGEDDPDDDAMNTDTVPEVVYTDPLRIVDSCPSSSGDDADDDMAFFDFDQEHSVADDHRGSAVTLFNMGLVHATNGSLEKAAQLFNMAKSVIKPHVEPALTACILNNLARVRYQSHDPTEAIKILTRALHLEQTAFADLEASTTTKDSSSNNNSINKKRKQAVSIEATIIDTLSLMSRLHFAHGDSAKSVELGRETLRIRRSIYGDGHLSVYCTLYNIGLALQRVGDAEDSLRHCAYFASQFTPGTDAGTTLQQKLARLSPTAKAQIGTALHNVGVMQLHNDSVTESVKTLEAALAVRRAALHTAPAGLHPDVADSLYQLGQILQNTGRDREAMDSYREAAHIFRRTIGPDHEDVAVVCCAMGQIHQSRGETDEALTVYAEVLRIAKLTFGPDDGFVAEVLGILGNVHLERGDTDAAMECFSESSRILGQGEGSGGDGQQQPLVVPSLAGFQFHPHAAAA